MPRPTDDLQNDERADTDARLTAALRSLPRVRAREGFTLAVMRRADSPPVPRPLVWRWATAAMMVLTLVSLSALVREFRDRRDLAQAKRALAEIRQEHRELQEEFEKLRSSSPVIYLGGNERLDVVVDTSRLADPEEFGDPTHSRREL